MWRQEEWRNNAGPQSQVTQRNNAAKVHTTQVTLIRIFRTWRMERNKARRCDVKTKEPSKVQRKTTTAESNHKGVITQETDRQRWNNNEIRGQQDPCYAKFRYTYILFLTISVPIVSQWVHPETWKVKPLRLLLAALYVCKKHCQGNKPFVMSPRGTNNTCCLDLLWRQNDWNDNPDGCEQNANKSDL